MIDIKKTLIKYGELLIYPSIFYTDLCTIYFTYLYSKLSFSVLFHLDASFISVSDLHGD